MPEYLAPGVFVEEVSFRSKSIEGVSTTTTGLVGPSRYGPIEEEPEVVTSLVEFERTYGDGQRLLFRSESDPQHNYLWHAARAFFEQGGKRLYVKRVFRPHIDPTGDPQNPFEIIDDCHADRWIPAVAEVPATRPAAYLRLRARFPGRAGGRRVRLTLDLGPNVLAGDPSRPRANGLLDRDLVWVSDQPSPPQPSPPSPPADQGFFALAEAHRTVTGEPTFRFHRITAQPGSPPAPVELAVLRPDPDPGWSDKVRILTATVTVLPDVPDDLPWIRSELPLDPRHAALNNAPDSLLDICAEDPPTQALRRTNPIVIEPSAAVQSGADVLALLFAEKASLAADVADPAATEDDRSLDLPLSGGLDGERPTAAEYTGDSPLVPDERGIDAFEDLEDISIVAAPGSTYGYENGYRSNGATIIQALIGHAERMRYRIAVIDSGEGQTLGEVQALRGTLDSKHAALYYPWVRVLDPITQVEIVLPPSGFVAGIYARNDVNRAVYKAPANEVVTGAIGFERLLNTAQQEVLNPLGINCLRFFEGRGYRVWGARTISSDPEWKYVNLRRYFAYLERSIDRGTQWAVFEPNGEALWANVRRTIGDFLFNEFQNGALLGRRPEDAFFVKCDRSTMTQNDLDNGRLVVLVGVAALRPAEFVIFRIGQWTADRRS